MPVVLAATRVGLDAARARWPAARLVLAGKSMGARAATLLAAGESDALGDGSRPDVAALVALGYPLHPPQRPLELRVAHFPRIATPLVVAQGTRDPFGAPDELAPHLAQVAAPWSLLAIDGGDHDFAVPRRLGRSQLDVCGDAARDTLAFVVQHLSQ
jgi:predicted alpha/beta-hydrolase family hydrolase